MLLLVSSAAGGLIHKILQWEEVTGVQPTYLNRSVVSAGYVLVGGLTKEKGTPGAKSAARRESSVKYQIPMSYHRGDLCCPK